MATMSGFGAGGRAASNGGAFSAVGRKQERSNSGSGSMSGAGIGMGAKKKKMTIKPFKVTPKLPEAFEDDSWAKLEAALLAVHNKQPTALSREELYRAVEDLCTWKMAER